MEIWKDIKGHEGEYQISDHARIRSLDRITPSGRHVSGKIITPVFKGGYWTVGLYHKGNTRTLTIHSLMGKMFLTNPGRYRYLKFKDGNVDNYQIDNLEYSVGSKKTELKRALAGMVNMELYEKPIRTGEQMLAEVMAY